MRSSLHTVMVVLCLVALGSCAQSTDKPLLSPWTEQSDFGYRERDLGPSRVEVTYKTPFERTSLDPKQREPSVQRVRELANDLAQWRAAEIAQRRGYTAFTVTNPRFVPHVDEYSQTMPPRYGLAIPGSGVRYIQSPGLDVRGAWVSGESTIDIELKHVTDAGDFDAAATLQHLAEKYAGAGVR